VQTLTLLVRQACTLDFRGLAAFRMAVGLLVCVDALLRSRDLTIMFDPDGMFPLPLLRAYFSDDPAAWSLATLVDARWWGAAVLWLQALAGMLLAVGCGTRFATIVSWLAVVSILRRTAPATNAGDAWLACLLFWGMFLPLGGVWSWDRRHRGCRGTICSFASVALVLQIAVVYLAAGLSKWNDTWLSGDAIRFALSVHDHGTPLGEWLLAGGWMARPISWGVLAVELLGPVAVIALPAARPRMGLVILFMLFHLASCLTMSIGLFGYVGLAAWLAMVPQECWDWYFPCSGPGPGTEATPNGGECSGRLSWPARWACLAAGTLAMVSLVHDMTPWRHTPLPRLAASLINLSCLHQEWRMFGDVQRQEQWVYASAELADGCVVDLLRGGRPLEIERPAGGFTSLPHHRWHKLFWALPRPRQRPFGPAIAAAIVRQWNGCHPAGKQVVSLEIRFARQGCTATDDTLHELLLASWPPRDATGRGMLDRVLDGPQDARGLQNAAASEATAAALNSALD
jgi:hypothetical protein